ncbi:hypothetical protein MC885_016070 [Smutsia gigantea]|nr:hypothetical protein MC885_016070 [Smutsia gigantea]
MESSLCLKPAQCFLTRRHARLLSGSLVQNGCFRRLETEAALGRKVTSVSGSVQGSDGSINSVQVESA